MTRNKREPVPPIPSATILLLRDGSRDLEVFMVQRHHEVDFARGALVFPGGKVDPTDREPGLRKRCDGAPDSGDELALCVAAIRETFEESGILLARPRPSRDLVIGERLRGIESRHREALNRSEIRLGEIAEAEDLTLACDLLVPFAHWITPEVSPNVLAASSGRRSPTGSRRRTGVVGSNWTAPGAAWRAPTPAAAPSSSLPAST
jgi:8-oxo-dGTP pyrophosphatase MutT (NUDIX family)